MKTAFKHAVTLAKLGPGVSPHTLRHTAATWLREATGDTRLVAEYLGHTDLSTVSRYAHVAAEELHAAAQALADHAQERSSRTQARSSHGADGRAKQVHPEQLAAWE